MTLGTLRRTWQCFRGRAVARALGAALAVALAWATLGTMFGAARAATSAATSNVAGDGQLAFLDFPLAVQTVGASKADAFAWLVRQGDRTRIRYAAAPNFEPRTLFETVDHDGQPVSTVALSADGRFVVYATGAGFGDGQTYNSAGLLEPPPVTLWAVGTSGNAQPRRIGPGSDPLFAPAGARLLYRSGKDLHLVDLDASADGHRVLMAGGAALADLQWSPQGEALAFSQDRGGHAFIGIYRPGEDRVRWLVTGPDRATAPTWSPDGKHVAFLQFPGREHTKAYDYTQSEPLAVGVVDVLEGSARMLWRSQGLATIAYAYVDDPDVDDPDSALRWVGNDRLVFYSEHDGWGRLYALSADGAASAAAAGPTGPTATPPVPLTPPKCEVAESELLGTSELLIVHNCADLHTRQLSIVDARGGAAKSIDSDDLVMAHAVAAGAGRFAAYTGGDTGNAPLLRILDVRSRKPVLRERPAAFGYRGAFEAPAPSIVVLKAQDGMEVPAQLFLPQGKGPHPALVYVHGGPQRQMFPAFHYMGYYASGYAFNRRLAELGYVVLSINYRSGTGYGRAFREAEHRGWNGASEYQDVLAAVRSLAARADVDARRIGIWGGSYGGLLTAQALARDSDLFAAGVAIHGFFDLSWSSPTPGHLNPSRFFGVSEATRERAFESSPLGAIDGWKSPVLLFSGDQDMHVDVRETVDLAQKLRARGVQAKTVIIPGEGHGFVRHETWRRLWRELSMFFAQQLGAE